MLCVGAMLGWARYRFLLVAPFAFLLTTCVPAQRFEGKSAYAAEKSAGAPALATAPEIEVAAPHPPTAPARIALWTERLAAIRVRNANTEEDVQVRLYAADGAVDADELAGFRRIVAAKGAPPAPMDARLVQLVVKAAYHFGARSVIVVSAYRPSRKRSAGKHASGEAIDFKLPGVDSKKIASYVRKYPRAGVGIYTNPGTQYVHLDVRDESFHWLDASPPGKSWHEKRLSDPNREERDAAYTPESDLPDN